MSFGSCAFASSNAASPPCTLSATIICSSWCNATRNHLVSPKAYEQDDSIAQKLGKQLFDLSNACSTRWQGGDLLEPRPQIKQCSVAKGGRDQRYPERQTARSEPRRERDRREIEQVDEAGV